MAGIAETLTLARRRRLTLGGAAEPARQLAREPQRPAVGVDYFQNCSSSGEAFVKSADCARSLMKLGRIGSFHTSSAFIKDEDDLKKLLFSR